MSALVELRDLVKYFPVKGGILRKTVGQGHTSACWQKDNLDQPLRDAS